MTNAPGLSGAIPCFYVRANDRGFVIFTRLDKVVGTALVAGLLAGCSGGGGSTQGVTPDTTVNTDHHWRGSWDDATSNNNSAAASNTITNAATPTPTTNGQSLSAQTGGSSGPTHILTYQQPLSLSGGYAQASKYLSYAITNSADAVGAHASGIKVGYYFDIHSICQSGSFGACLIGAVTTPESAFEHTCDGTNARISDTHSGGVTQFVTNPASSGTHQILASVIAMNASAPWDFGFSDDAQDLAEISPYYNYVNSNTGAPQVPAPYCNFNDSSFISGMQSFYASSSMPLIANALMPSGSSSASNGTKYFSGAAPLIGEMLEGIYGSSFNGSDRYKESGSIWQSEENSEIATAAANRLFIGFEHVGGTDSSGLNERTYIYASLMLGFSLKSTVLAEDGTSVRSNIYVNPEALLVPTNPLRGNPSSIASLQQSGGAYAREFANCYYNGAAIGACAAVVNSSSSGNVPLPALSGNYTHTAVISGAGVIAGTDNGSLNLSGPHAPSTIQAEEAYVLTK